MSAFKCRATVHVTRSVGWIGLFAAISCNCIQKSRAKPLSMAAALTKLPFNFIHFAALFELALRFPQVD